MKTAVSTKILPFRQVRAVFDVDTVTVYQAYSSHIAVPAVRSGTFVPPFSLNRMTWIKPSFLWMMYRSGWGTKEGQEHILAVRITREGFESALSMACLSHFDSKIYSDKQTWKQLMVDTSVRVQWDPERSVDLKPLPWRSIQIGLCGMAAKAYVDEWIVGIDDITEQVHELSKSAHRDLSLLPKERPYVLPSDIARRIDAG